MHLRIIIFSPVDLNFYHARTRDVLLYFFHTLDDCLYIAAEDTLIDPITHDTPGME